MSLLAQRYAQALYDTAILQNSGEKVVLDVVDLTSMIQGSQDLRQFLRNPLLSTALAEKTLEALIKKAKLSTLIHDFLLLLSRHKRLSHLLKILEAFKKIDQAQEKTILVKVTSAQAVSAEHLQRLKAALQRKTSREIVFEEKIDPRLLGGLIVEMGEYRLDSTLQTRLTELEKKIRGL